MIEIVALRSAENGGAVLAECVLTGDDVEQTGGKPRRRRSFMLLPEFYRELGLKKGPLGREAFMELAEADEKSRAFFAGERLLGYASNSSGQITYKLRRRGFSAAAAEFAGIRLAASGEIDERRDAVRMAERLAASGKGRIRIMGQLAARSYGPDAMAAASEYLGTVDFPEICAGVIKKKWGAFPEDPDARKKAVAALMRLGFSSEDIRGAVRRR
jgi:SOS response regulatory protein OraA/RecX